MQPSGIAAHQGLAEKSTEGRKGSFAVPQVLVYLSECSTRDSHRFRFGPVSKAEEEPS